MKVPLEILTATLLLWLGWSQSFSDQWARIMGLAVQRARSAPVAVSPSPQAPGSKAVRSAPNQPTWMREPTVLDQRK